MNARDELNQGIQAYKLNKIEDAVQHFKAAVTLDDKRANAHLYLATALATEYTPGSQSPDNVQLAEQAIQEYKRVMELSPEDSNCVKGIAALLFNVKRLEESKEYHRKVIELDPNDPESYYAIAVIDWMQAYTAKGELVSTLDLKMSDPLIDKSECWTLRNENGDRVKEGIEMLTKALELRPDYDDAMAYLNLLYRQRADIQCGDKAAYNADTVIADKWVNKAMATKKTRAEKERPVPQSKQY